MAQEQLQGVSPDPVRRLAALLPADPELGGQVAARFRLSGAQRKRLVLAAGRNEKPLPFRGGVGVGSVPTRGAGPKGQTPPPTPSPEEEGALAARTLAYRIGIEQARDCLLLTGQGIASLTGWTIPEFPLKGGQIVERGVKAGPEVARILRTVEDRWVAEGFPGEARVWKILEQVLPESSHTL